MKLFRTIVTLLLCCFVSFASAQDENTSTVMAFKDFKPARVKLTDGRTIKVPKANVFLKHSTLVYKSGNSVKEANTKAV